MRPSSFSRREFGRLAGLAGVAALGAKFTSLCPTSAAPARAPAANVLDPDAMAFLRGIAAATIQAARVSPGADKPGGGVNSTGIPLITPGGNYPAFWIRDYAMSLDCGLIGPEHMLPQLKLIARCQSGATERRLRSGGIIPPYSIPDHIRMDGQPVFYPGTYSAGEDQGGDPWGPLPPVDDHFYFIHVAYANWRATKLAAFLGETIGELPLLDRLIKAFNAPETDAKTGAVVALPPRRAVGFGFDDSIYMLGAMSFATLLRWRAARQLAELCQAAGKASQAGDFRRTAGTIADHLLEVFSEPATLGGWLRGATQRCRQPDVWATLFALHLGILPPAAARRARESVVEAVRAGSRQPVIEYQGAVRHVPTTHDFSATTAWEGAAGKGRYQNGAYWHTATGWLIEALHVADPVLARAVFERYFAHLRRYDFRNGKDGAPWECFGVDLQGAQNPVYMTSVTLPLGALQNMVPV